MAKITKSTANLKAGKLTGKVTKNIVDTNYFSPNTGAMSGKQQYKLGKMQQRTTRAENRQSVRKFRAGVSKGAELARGIGSGISQITTPFATEYGAQKITEQHYASKSAEASLAKWNDLLDSNPDKDKGADGSKQNDSTTTKGGGSMIGG